jgi:hypothetical protein
MLKIKPKKVIKSSKKRKNLPKILKVLILMICEINVIKSYKCVHFSFKANTRVIYLLAVIKAENI